jgi:hypothetical protein
LPLIAVPRFLQLFYECARDTTRPYNCGEEIAPLLHEIGYPIVPTTSEDILSACQYIGTCNVLKFPPERVASSLVDLWEDLANEESRGDFLKYCTGWIGHSVLFFVKDSSATEVIERFIEIACCLDLLCQEHLLAVHTVQSLQIPAIQRVTAWNAVRPPLLRNMDEIVGGSLAHGLDPNASFRMPRDMLLEYWLLSRAYVDEQHLLVESLIVQPPVSKTSDVETRITALEAILNRIENAKSEDEETEPEFDDLSMCEFSDRESELWDSTDGELSDGHFDSDDLANKTRARTAIRLQQLKDSVRHKVDNLQNPSVPVKLEMKTSPPTGRSRSLDPFDQGSIFRARARNTPRAIHLS